jgi:tetratricopeptide (TPR) repeat protein
MKNDNHDAGERSRLIRIFCWTLPLGLVLLLVCHPLVAFGSYLAINLIIDRLICASGNGLAGLISGFGYRHRTVDDLCKGDIDRARFYRRNGRYDEALAVIDQILDKVPDYPEALYLKADILWQGFAHRQSAMACLERIQASRKADSTMQEWAKNYYHHLKTHNAPGASQLVSRQKDPTEPPL